MAASSPDPAFGLLGLARCGARMPTGFTELEKTALWPRMVKEERLNLINELRRLMRTAGYSLDGWRHAWREEKSLRQWAGVNVASWAALVLLRPSPGASALVFFAGILLLVVELINSAVEATVDLATTERHPLAKAAKDTASAAVAVLGLGFVGVWVMTLLALF